MEEKKHRKPRPEMGTPEYEEWRKRMLQRRRERLKRERRKRLIAIGVAAVLIAGGVSAGKDRGNCQSSGRKRYTGKNCF